MEKPINDETKDFWIGSELPLDSFPVLYKGKNSQEIRSGPALAIRGISCQINSLDDSLSSKDYDKI